MLKRTRDKIKSDEDGDEDTAIVLSVTMDYPRQYSTLSLEKRALIFDIESLSSIENAYQYFNIYSQGFKHELVKYKLKKKSLRDILNFLKTESLMKYIEDALVLIEKNHPSVKSKSKR